MKVSYSRMYFVDYDTKRWPKGKKKPLVWTFVDDKFEKLYAMDPKKRAKLLAAIFAADKAKFPIPESNVRAFPKRVTMPQWQANSAAAVAAMRLYGITSSRTAQQDEEAAEAADDEQEESGEPANDKSEAGDEDMDPAHTGDEHTGDERMGDQQIDDEGGSDGFDMGPAGNAPNSGGQLDSEDGDNQPPNSQSSPPRPARQPPHPKESGSGPIRHNRQAPRPSPIGPPATAKRKVTSSVPNKARQPARSKQPAGQGTKTRSGLILTGGSHGGRAPGTSKPASSASETASGGSHLQFASGTYDPATSETGAATLGIPT